MTRRTRIWLAVAAAFTLINLGGAVYAALRAETLHCLAHVAGAVVGLAWIWWLMASARRRELADPISGGDARLDNLQQSVDAIAIEVERIGEAQRFNAKLEAERRKTPG